MCSEAINVLMDRERSKKCPKESRPAQKRPFESKSTLFSAQKIAHIFRHASKGAQEIAHKSKSLKEKRS